MEHRLGAALRSGSSVLAAVVSDNTALHTAIHTAIHSAIQRAQRALQVAEGHQLTAGARKLADWRLANFSSLLYTHRNILEFWWLIYPHDWLLIYPDDWFLMIIDWIDCRSGSDNVQIV